MSYAFLVYVVFFDVTTAVAGQDEEEGFDEEVVNKKPSSTMLRSEAKPWYLRNIEFKNIKIPLSPVTLVIMWFSLYFVIKAIGPKEMKWVEASHILLKDPSEETRKKLDDMKKQIGKDATQFARHASKFSECPSGKRGGGNLGHFRQHDMAEKFDAICFDPETPVGMVVGPIQTQFGWHLIYIHERKLE